MVSVVKKLELSIKESMLKHYGSGSFDDFAKEMLKLGVMRITHDALLNESHFYAEAKHIYTMKMESLVEAQKEPWILGAFNALKVQKAISDYDGEKIDAVQFHKDIFSAGVVFGTVFLKAQKIYYQGADGQSYEENYS